MSEKLVIVRGQEKGREFDLTGTRMTLGSDEDCSIPVHDEGVVGSHAVIEKENGAWYLRPAAAENLVQFDEHPVHELRLEHGAVFQLGRAHLRFVTPRAAIEINPLAGEGIENQEEAVEQLRQAHDQIQEQVSSIIIGQQEVLNQILVALFARGHCLIIGVPGLAKTLMVRVLSGVLDLEGKRIQFTPDLMPSDITGTDILEEDSVTHTRQFRFNRGPLFTNVLLADEINRTPPKTQAALLEAMQERSVTIDGTRHDLGDGFMVVATQNPIEQEGTYPLPEAQLDRFLLKVDILYPNRDHERAMVQLHGHRSAMPPIETFGLERVADLAAIQTARQVVSGLRLTDPMVDYIVDLVRATREHPSLMTGASPRACNMLATAARAYAALLGRDFVIPDDVKRLAVPCLGHRVVPAPGAEIEGLSGAAVLRQVIEQVPAPR